MWIRSINLPYIQFVFVSIDIINFQSIFIDLNNSVIEFIVPVIKKNLELNRANNLWPFCIIASVSRCQYQYMQTQIRKKTSSARDWINQAKWKNKWINKKCEIVCGNGKGVRYDSFNYHTCTYTRTPIHTVSPIFPIWTFVPYTFDSVSSWS